MRTTTKRSAREAQLDDDGESKRMYKGKFRGAARVDREMMKNLRTSKNREYLPSRSGDNLPRDMRGKFLNSIPTSLFRPGANVVVGGERGVTPQTEQNWETEESAVIAPANLYVQDPQIRRITEAALQRVNYAPMLQKWQERNSKLEQQPILQQGRTWLTSDSAKGAPFEPYNDGGDFSRHNNVGLFAAAKSGFGKNRGLSVVRGVFSEPTNRGIDFQDPHKNPASYSQAMLSSLSKVTGINEPSLREMVSGAQDTPTMLNTFLAMGIGSGVLAASMGIAPPAGAAALTFGPLAMGAAASKLMQMLSDQAPEQYDEWAKANPEKLAQVSQLSTAVKELEKRAEQEQITRMEEEKEAHVEKRLKQWNALYDKQQKAKLKGNVYGGWKMSESGMEEMKKARTTARAQFEEGVRNRVYGPRPNTGTPAPTAATPAPTPAPTETPRVKEKGEKAADWLSEKSDWFPAPKTPTPAPMTILGPTTAAPTPAPTPASTAAPTPAPTAEPTIDPEEVKREQQRVADELEASVQLARLERAKLRESQALWYKGNVAAARETNRRNFTWRDEHANMFGAPTIAPQPLPTSTWMDEPWAAYAHRVYGRPGMKIIGEAKASLSESAWNHFERTVAQLAMAKPLGTQRIEVINRTPFVAEEKDPEYVPPVMEAEAALNPTVRTHNTFGDTFLNTTNAARASNVADNVLVPEGAVIPQSVSAGETVTMFNAVNSILPELARTARATLGRSLIDLESQMANRGELKPGADYEFNLQLKVATIGNRVLQSEFEEDGAFISNSSMNQLVDEFFPESAVPLSMFLDSAPFAVEKLASSNAPGVGFFRTDNVFALLALAAKYQMNGYQDTDSLVSAGKKVFDFQERGYSAAYS